MDHVLPSEPCLIHSPAATFSKNMSCQSRQIRISGHANIDDIIIQCPLFLGRCQISSCLSKGPPENTTSFATPTSIPIKCPHFSIFLLSTCKPAEDGKGYKAHQEVEGNFVYLRPPDDICFFGIGSMGNSLSQT